MPAGAYYLTKHGLDGHRYRLGHPLAQHVLDQAAQRNLSGAHVTFDYAAWKQKTLSLQPFVGASGIMAVRKLSISGADAQDHILIAAVTDDGRPIDASAAHRLFELPVRNVVNGIATPPMATEQSLEAQKNTVLAAMAERQSTWFDQEMTKLDAWADDKRAGLKFDLKELDDTLKDLKRQIRQTGNLPDKLAVQRKARDFEKKRDEAWRSYDEAAKHIEVEKDALLDRVEEQLAQTVTSEDLFTITFQID